MRPAGGSLNSIIKFYTYAEGAYTLVATVRGNVTQETARASAETLGNRKTGINAYTITIRYARTFTPLASHRLKVTNRGTGVDTIMRVINIGDPDFRTGTQTIRAEHIHADS